MRIGIVGLGFMGRVHLANWSRCQGVQVAAICEKNATVLKDMNKPVGNIGGSATAVDLTRLHTYSDPVEMLRREQLDAVSIALPTHLHAATSIQALQAGVPVLCEKPMALTIEQCRSMIAAARQSGKYLMIGHCIRFWPEYATAKKIIDDGQYGKVVSAAFRRISTAPTWCQDNWLVDRQRSGGMVLDLHIHDTDFVHYLFGMPKAVCSHAAVRHNSIMHIHTQYDFGDSRAITAEGSWLAAPSFGFEMSFNIMLEQATLVYDCTRNPTFRLYPDEGESFTPEIAPGDGYGHEIAHFAAKIQGKQPPEVLTPEQSMDSVQIIQAEQQSAVEGRRVSL